MNIRPLYSHCQAIEGLTGVLKAQTNSNQQGDEMKILTQDVRAAQRLDDIVADEILGRPVTFAYAGPGQMGKEPSCYTAEEILKDYGSLIEQLPGVTQLGTITIKAGDWLPAFEEAVEVVTETPEQASLAKDILEDEINGVGLKVRTQNESFDEFGNCH